LRILNAAEVRQALPMAEAIAGMKRAFAQLSTGRAQTPLRNRLDASAVDGVALFMPAFLPEEESLAIKVVSVFPENPRRGEPIIYATVLVLDPETGRPLALLEGGSLTAIRTGAGSGAATDLLARPEAASVAIIGSGVQARSHLEAVCTVRNIRRVRVYSPTLDHAVAFAEEMAGQGPIPADVTVTESAAKAVVGADIVCTTTTSTSPVFPGRDLSLGTHINAVGSFTPQMQEIDEDTVARALVVVDSREAVWAEAGDLLVPLKKGLIDEDHIWAEVGEIVAGTRTGREDAQQITLFKSVGVAVQDVVAAGIALRNAERLGLGTEIRLS